MGWDAGDVQLMLDSASLYNVDGHRRAAASKASGSSVGSKGGEGGDEALLEKLLVYQEGPLTAAMTHVASELSAVAVQLFGLILRYTADGAAGGAAAAAGKQREMDAVKMVELIGKHQELRDEAYAQLCKQTRKCPSAERRKRAWELLHLLASCFPPTHHFLEIVYDYCDSVVRGGASSPGGPGDEHIGADLLSKRLDAGFEMGPRKSLPTPDEVLAILGGGVLEATVYYLNDDKVTMRYDPRARVGDALQALLEGLGVRDVLETFSLYVALRPPQGFRSNAAYAVEADMKLLESKQYMADAIAESRGVTSTHGAGGAHSYCLLLKRRYFSELDEEVEESTFIHLSYVQAQSEVLSGNYPVALGDSAQMAALMLQAERGDLVKVAAPAAVKVLDYLPETTAAEKSKAAWDKDIRDRWTAMRGMDSSVAKQHILHFLRSLPYGNASFYKVRPAEDPLKLFPSKLIMGVNKRGLHFFRPIPKEYLLSVDLKDIMQFGNSSSSVFFKIRIAGFLHLFQFDTRQGGDVCSALQMFINEAMARRAQNGRGPPSRPAAPAGKAGTGVAGGHAASAGANGVGPPPTPSGGARRSSSNDVETLLKEKKELVNKCEELEGEKQAIESMLDELMDRLTMEEKSRAASEATAEGLQQQIATLSEHLSAAKSEKGPGSTDTALKAELEKVQKELQAAQAARAKAESAVANLTNEKKLVQNQLERAQKAHEQALQGTSARVKDAEKVVAEQGAQIRALEEELDLARAGLGEVQELRDFRADVERTQQRAAELIAIQTAKLEDLEKSYREELTLRKQYFNQLQDLKGKIRVFARCRPLGKSEIAKGEEDVITFPNDMTLAHPGKEPGSKKEWDFDTCFPGTSTQQEVFSEAKYLVQSAVDGYNVCIFAYGQTGSGKTHTIYGDSTPEGEGLTPRAVRELFSIIRRNSQKLSISVQVYMLELYLDNLQDLLGDPKASTKLEVKKTPKGNVTVVGAKVLAANSPEQLLEIIQNGSKSRHTSATKMNDESSRSHLVCSILIESTNIQTQVQTVGKLSFVDLAGSERVKKSGATGDVMKEAQSINKSLSALGDVISALSAGQPHIPYRNHKLTMLMSDSLGGNAKTLMFVACSPAKMNLEETQNSLQYATRVRTIKNDVTKQEESKEVQRLRKMVSHWKSRAGEGGDDLVDITDTSTAQQQDP